MPQLVTLYRPSDPCADQRHHDVLTLAQAFVERQLPWTVRRVAAWRRLPRNRVPELTADLAQELAVDALQHTELLLTMPEAERSRRWQRLAERWLYHERMRSSRLSSAQLPEPRTGPPPADAATTYDLPVAPEAMVRLGNGRTNYRVTAEQTGTNPRALMRRLDHWADRHGRGRAFSSFWQARAAEAMTGLAADLLQQQARLTLVRRRRQRPSPEARLRRLRRIARRFPVRPSTRATRALLRPWLRWAGLRTFRPRPLLESALLLAPQATAAWLWLFEASFVEGDLGAALAAIRSARHLATPTPREQVLARARVLEARGRLAAAAALLQRARCRWPADGCLVEVATRLAAGSSPTGC